MFHSSISGQDIPAFCLSISSPISCEAYGLPLKALTSPNTIFTLPNELVGSITEYSLQEKVAAADYLVREKINAFIHNPNVDELTGIAFGKNYQTNLASSLLQTQANYGFQGSASK